MPKIEKKPIDIQDVRVAIVNAIDDKYKMTVNAFSKSEYPEKWGLSGKSIPNYLSPSGSISYKSLQTLYKKLRLGNLSRKVAIEKKVTYYTG